MRKNLLSFFIIWLAVSSCESENSGSKCYHGKVIMSSCCSGTSFIALDSSTPIGKATKLNGLDFKNVIQVPGYLIAGEIYLNLREYDQQKDDALFPNPHCYCLVAVGMDVPMWVQTGYSSKACPLDQE